MPLIYTFQKEKTCGSLSLRPVSRVMSPGSRLFLSLFPHSPSLLKCVLKSSHVPSCWVKGLFYHLQWPFPIKTAHEQATADSYSSQVLRIDGMYQSQTTSNPSCYRATLLYSLPPVRSPPFSYFTVPSFGFCLTSPLACNLFGTWPIHGLCALRSLLPPRGLSQSMARGGNNL